MVLLQRARVALMESRPDQAVSRVDRANHEVRVSLPLEPTDDGGAHQALVTRHEYAIRSIHSVVAQC